MKEDILKTAADLFLNYGFKSVTKDDIANALGISKKTIYQYFENKSILVEETTLFMFHSISKDIETIIAQQKNPIEEVYEIKRLIMAHLKDEKSSPEYQLQKYYPKLYDSLKTKRLCVLENSVISNLNRGVKSGLYRDTINTEFISKIYYSCTMALKDKASFPLNNFSVRSLMNHYIEYHLRGICTPKGIEYLTLYLENNKIQNA